MVSLVVAVFSNSVTATNMMIKILAEIMMNEDTPRIHPTIRGSSTSISNDDDIGNTYS
jgi:hypothetical protein